MKQNSLKRLLLIFVVIFAVVNMLAPAQSAWMRWEMMNQIRQDKFDLILPKVMCENKIDMWITMMKEGNYGPLYEDFGRGYISDIGFYIFSDRGGERIERAALGVHGYMIEKCGVYDIFGSVKDLKEFVKARNPKRIGVNISDKIGAADSLTHMGFLYLKKTLGASYSNRLVSAEKLVSDFRSQRVASEIVAFGQAGMISKEIAERALSNEVIIPGQTMLQDVAWWILEELQRRNLGSSFDMPSIYITGPNGIEAVSNDRIIQRGDVIMIDWGHGIGPSIATFNPLRMNFIIQPTNMFVIEFFAYTQVPEWGGKKLRIPLEDDAIVMENGINWLYPIQDRILLIR